MGRPLREHVRFSKVFIHLRVDEYQGCCQAPWQPIWRYFFILVRKGIGKLCPILTDEETEAQRVYKCSNAFLFRSCQITCHWNQDYKCHHIYQAYSTVNIVYLPFPLSNPPASSWKKCLRKVRKDSWSRTLRMGSSSWIRRRGKWRLICTEVLHVHHITV